MRQTVCQICLSTDFQSIDVDPQLFLFYDELCEFDVLYNDKLKFCTICGHILRKFYNFRQRCQLARNILKTHRKKGLENLQNRLAPSRIGFASPLDNQKIINLITCDEDQPENNEIQNDELMEMVIKMEDIDDPIPVTENINLNPDLDILKQENISKQDDFAMSCTQMDLTIINQNDIRKNYKILKSDDKIFNKEEILQNDEIIIENEVTVDGQSDDIENFDFDGKEITIMNTKKDLKPKKIICYKKAMKPKLEQVEIDDIISVDDLKYIDNSKMKQQNLLHKRLARLKEKVINILEHGTLDLGEHVKMNKETFLDMLENCDKFMLQRTIPGMLKNDSGTLQRIKKFLLYLWKHFDPKFETVFRIEYLNTHAKKLAEFAARSKSEEYLQAEFKCDICYRIFEVPHLFEGHKKLHDESRELACEICSMRFESRKHIQHHGRNNHNCVFRCRLCDFTTYSFEAMKIHYDKHKGKTLKCDSCYKEFRSLSTYYSHRLTHATHPCPHCARNFVSTLGLRLHIKLKHPVTDATSDSPQVTCDTCGAAFNSKELLIKHIRRKHGHLRSYKCHNVSCKESFASLPELKAHIVSACHGRSAPRPRQVNRPRLGQHGHLPYRKCGICGELVKNVEHMSLPHHYKEAHPDVPYILEDCRHLCEYCGRAFRSFNYDHMNIHTGAKPYDCSECGERFHTFKKRENHRLFHFPPQFKCKVCGKMFRSAANLYSHMRSHVRDRRYKCKICSKGFLHPGAMKEHVRGVHHHICRVKTGKAKATK